MPRINKIRLVNVHFNEGKGYYENFEMDFKGDDSTFQLRNGGGKSLMYMMMMQTILPNTYLKPEKPVKDIFNGVGNETSHALVEWILDDHGQEHDYLVTGFCARKKQDKEETADDSGMDYYNYVLTYNHNDPNNISRLPLIQYTDNKKTVMDFNTLKKEINRINETSNGKTFAEHFHGRRIMEYRQYLRDAYRIIDVEWEIMAKVNSSENNLAGTFREHKQSRTVIENFLVETVVDKINKTSVEDSGVNEEKLMNIKEYVELAREQYNKREDYRVYQAGVKKLSEHVSEILGVTSSKDAIGVKFSYLAKKLEKTIEEKEVKQKEYEKNIQDLSVLLFNLDKELNHFEISRKKLLINELRTKKETSEKELGLKKIEVEELTTELDEYTAINDYVLYRDNELKVLKLSEKLANAGKTNDVLGREREQAGIQYRIKLEQEHQKDLVEFYQISENNKNNKIKFNSVGAEINELSKDIGTNEAEIRNNNRQMGDCLKKYDELIALLNEQSLCVFLSSDIQEHQHAVEARQGALSVEINDLNKRLVEVGEQIYTLNLKIGTLENEKVHLARQFDAAKVKLESYQNKFDQLTELCGLYSQPNKENLYDYFRERAGQLRQNLYRLTDNEEDIKKQLEIIKEHNLYIHDARLLELEQELSRKFSSVHLGAKFLQEHNPDERESLLNKCPLLPYGILLTNQDFDKLKRMEKGFSSRFIDAFLPIINIDVLQNGDGFEDTAVFFPTRNKHFIHETLTDITGYQAKKNEELKKIEKDIVRAQEELSECDVYLKQINSYIENYSELSVASIIAEFKTSEEAVLRNQKQWTAAQEQLNAEQKMEKECRTLLVEKEARSKVNEAILKQLNEAKSLDSILQTLKGQEKNFKSKLETTIEAQRSKEKEREELDKLIQQEQQKIAQYESKARRYKEELDKLIEFPLVDIERAVELGLRECQIKYDELNQSYNRENSNLVGFRDQIDDLKVNQEHLFQRIDSLGFSIDWFKVRRDIQKIENSLLEQKKHELKSVNARIKELDDKLIKERATLSTNEGIEQQLLKDYEEKYGDYILIEDTLENLKKQEEKNRAQQREFNQELSRIKNLNKELGADLERLGKEVMSVSIFMKTNKIALLELEDIDGNISDNFDVLVGQIEGINKSLEQARKRFKDEIDKLQKKSKQILVEYQVLGDIKIPETSDEATDLANQLDVHNEILDEKIAKITYEYEQKSKVKNDFVDACLSMASETYEYLNKINLLSRVNIPDVGKKEMVKIELEKPYDLGIQRSRMNDHIDSLIENINSNKMMNKDARSISKFIRDELSSKRLLSCITDMTKSKLFLFKVEEIPENSRYLRWEKAVESDGQTLMLYFMFLITVVLYIRNQVFEDDSSDHKVLFIENPFGPTSAIYLWRVMHEMLKENKIQLITTGHNITKELLPYFGVNYLLKHDLLPGKILRVMVDFQGQVDTSQLEEKQIVMQQSIFDN